MRHQLALGVILATILGAWAGGGGTTAPTASPAGSPTATVATKATSQPTTREIPAPVTPPNVAHLRAYLQKNGISASDVQFVTTTTAARVQQLVSGGTDTAILHVDQVLTVKKTAPNIAVLANMWEVLTDYQYAVYAVPTAEAKSATTECMLRAVIRANRAMYDPTLRSRILDMAVRETKADRDVVEAAYKTLESGKAWPQNEGIPQKK